MAATVVSAKGCVARCTFCHRWDRGYRHWPVDSIMDNISYLMERYNVGFINFGDENFGSDRKKLDEFIQRVKPLDLLWHVGGVRRFAPHRDSAGINLRHASGYRSECQCQLVTVAAKRA